MNWLNDYDDDDDVAGQLHQDYESETAADRAVIIEEAMITLGFEDDPDGAVAALAYELFGPGY